jgi:phage terminase small subunit
VAWGRLTVLLDGMGVLTVADTLALERLCDIYADILQLRDTIAVEGRTYTVQTEGGFLIKLTRQFQCWLMLTVVLKVTWLNSV